MKKFINKKTINILFAVIGLTIIIYLIYRMKGYVADIDFSEIRFNYFYLAYSFLLIPIWFTLRCYVWKRILKEMGEKISLIDSMRLIGLSNFGKYIPGKVWFAVGRTVLSERLGISKRKSFTSIIIDTYFLLLTSIIFLLIILFRISFQGTNYLFLIIILIVIMIPFLIPAFIKKIMNFIFTKLKKPSVEYNIKITTMIKIIFSDIIIWSLQGLQFLLLVKSFTDFSFNAFSVLLVYPGAWAMGFIVLLMPAGLGIREGFITFALIQIFPNEFKGIAVVAALLSRIQFTIGEFGYLITLIGSKKIWRKNEK